MEEHVKEMAEMRATITALTDDMAEIKTSMKGLLDAWNASVAFLGFLKVAATVTTAVLGTLAFFKFGAHKP